MAASVSSVGTPNCVNSQPTESGLEAVAVRMADPTTQVRRVSLRSPLLSSQARRRLAAVGWAFYLERHGWLIATPVASVNP